MLIVWSKMVQIVFSAVVLSIQIGQKLLSHFQ